MAYVDLDKQINVGSSAGGTFDESYLYPASGEMIAFNVSPYDNDGDESTQKWIPAFIPSYHPEASSLDAKYALSTYEGTGVVGAKTKTYPFKSAVSAIVNGTLKVGVFANGVNNTNGGNFPGSGGVLPLYDYGNFYVSSIGRNVGTWRFSGITMGLYSKGNNSKSGKTMALSFDSGGGYGVLTTASQHGTLSNGRSVFSTYMHDSGGISPFTSGVMIELTDGSVVNHSYTGSGAAGVVPIVKEDVDYIYVGLTTGAGTTRSRIDKITGDIVASVDTGTIVTMSNLASALTTPYTESVGDIDYVYAPTDITMFISPSYFNSNDLLLDVKVNGVVVDTVTVPFTLESLASFETISLSDIAVSSTSALIEVTSRVGMDGFIKLGYGVTGGTYYAPAGTNDASGDDSSGRSVGSDGMSISLELS